VHGSRGIDAAAIGAKEAQVAIGPEAAVAQRDPAKVVQERHAVGRVGNRFERCVCERAERLCELGADPLVGVEREDPAALGARVREGVLARKVVELSLQDARALLLRDGPGSILRAAVDHQDLVAKGERVEAVPEPRLLVLRDDGRGQDDLARSLVLIRH
jgi:hypothetical protein